MSHEGFPWEDTEAVAEMVRTALQGEFWAWYSRKVQQESQADILELADPATAADRVGFLRGKIRAHNEDLLLPRQLIAAYDYEKQAVTETAEVQDTPGQPRRLSPLLKEEDDDVGQPDQEA